MPPRLPTPSAIGAPLRPFSFLRPFSSTSAASAANDTPSSNPPPRASTTHSLAGLNNSNSASTARGAPRQQKQPPPKWQQRGDISSKLLERYRGRADDTTRNRQARLEVLRNQQISRDYLRQMPRNWDIGDVYSPNDLSPIEMAKWRKRSPRTADVVNALGIRPLDMYKVRKPRLQNLFHDEHRTDGESGAELLSNSGFHIADGRDPASQHHKA